MELGCFGSVVCFDLTSEQCKSCQGVKKCFTQANHKLSEMNIQDSVGFEKMKTKHVRWANKLGVKTTSVESVKMKLELSDDERTSLSGLPTGCLALAKAIVGKNIDVVDCLSNKINPFKHIKPSYMSCVWSLLLSNDHITSRVVTETLSKNFPQWSKQTVYSNTSNIIRVLMHFQVVSSIGNRAYKVNS